jgi:GTPase SAR1 family protein
VFCVGNTLRFLYDGNWSGNVVDGSEERLKQFSERDGWFLNRLNFTMWPCPWNKSKDFKEIESATCVPWNPNQDKDFIDLVQHMIHPDVKSRYVVNDVLRHRWTTHCPKITDTVDDSIRGAFEAALRSDGRPFRFSRVCLVGEGRAGKTALANALCHRPFVQTSSTIGVCSDSMEVSSACIEASSVTWKVLPSNAIIGLAQQQLNWETAQRLSGLSGIGEGSIHNLYTSQMNSNLSPHLVASHSVIAGPSESDRNISDNQSSETEHNDLAHTPSVRTFDATRNVVFPRAARKSIKAPVIETDHKLILQLQGQSEPLRISLIDFGGQEAFYSLHHLYVTRESVYLVVFNMTCLVGDHATAGTIKQCKDSLSFWLNSIFLHARVQTAEFDGSVAPIILVGTHKDVICSPMQHEQISKMLHDEFHLSPVWASVIPFQEGVVSTGRGLLYMFPVDNRQKLAEQDNVDTTVALIQKYIQFQLEQEDYIKRKVPLSWLRAFDAFMAAKESGRPYLLLDEVQEIAGNCGLPCLLDLSLDAEVIFMLKYFSGLGLIMHHDCPKLHNIVVLDLVRCLVNPASIIMCQHDIHQLPVHLEAKARQKDHYDELVSKGRVHRSLFQILWKDSLEIVNEVCELMVHYGLMLPILGDSTGSQDACAFLVPSLLPKEPLARVVGAAAVRSHFYFAFGSKRKVASWQADNTVTVKEIAAQGFCPNGLFSKLTGKIISECQQTYSYFKSRCSRHETATFFGKHQFLIRELKELNIIQILVLVCNPRRLLTELNHLVQSTIDEMIPNLSFCAAVRCDGGMNSNFEPDMIADAHLAVLTGEHGLIECCSKGKDFDAGEGPLSPVEIQRMFQLWLPPSGLLSSGYHVFLSYRWTGIDRQHWGFDEDLSMGIFQKLSMDALVGPEKEEVNVFLDKLRLQPARDFQSDFADALLSSSLPVVLMSSAALLKMAVLSTSSFIDNLLLEWTIIADLKATGVIKHCLVIFFGAHNKLASSCADVLGDIFEQKMPDVLAAVENDKTYDTVRKALAPVADLENKDIFSVLPDVAVQSINDKARCILHAHGLPVSPDISSRSVRQVVESLKLCIGVKTWEEAKKVNSSHAHEETLRVITRHCAHQICSILEKDRPCSALANKLPSTPSVVSFGADAHQDDLALQLQHAGLSNILAVLLEFSAKLQSNGVLAMDDMRGLSMDELKDVVKCLCLNVVQFNKLFKYLNPGVGQ